MKTGGTILALLGASALAVPAAAQTIDFNGGFASGPSYSEAGVTFTAGGQNIDAFVTPNGSLGMLANGSPRNEFVATLSNIANFVSVDLGDYNSDADLLFLEVFDSSNALLGSTSLAIDPNFTGMHTLSLSFGNISWARFGGRSPSFNGNSIYADNFTFRTLSSGVPEPSTWAMLVIGFGVVGGAMRVKRRKQDAVASHA